MEGHNTILYTGIFFDHGVRNCTVLQITVQYSNLLTVKLRALSALLYSTGQKCTVQYESRVRSYSTYNRGCGASSAKPAKLIQSSSSQYSAVQ